MFGLLLTFILCLPLSLHPFFYDVGKYILNTCSVPVDALLPPRFFLRVGFSELRF